MSEIQDIPPAPISPMKRKSDQRVRLAFLLVALGIVAWLLVRQYYGPRPPFDYTQDLTAALAKAKAENRRVLLIVYKRLPNEAYKDSMEKTLQQPANLEAFRKSNALCVRVMADDPALRKWLDEQGLQVDSTPAFLLLRPDGKAVWTNVDRPSQVYIGLMPEIAFAHGFLDAPPVRFDNRTEEVFAQARKENRNVLVLVDEEPPTEAGVELWEKTLWAPPVIAALDQANPLCLRLRRSQAAAELGQASAELPMILLMSPGQGVIAKQTGAVGADALVKMLLPGNPLTP